MITNDASLQFYRPMFLGWRVGTDSTPVIIHRPSGVQKKPIWILLWEQRREKMLAQVSLLGRQSQPDDEKVLGRSLPMALPVIGLTDKWVSPLSAIWFLARLASLSGWSQMSCPNPIRYNWVKVNRHSDSNEVLQRSEYFFWEMWTRHR